MQNRFRFSEEDRRRRTFPWVAVVLCALLLILGVVIFQQAAGQMAEEQQQSLESALMRGVVQCYAFEGRYPESLDYLKEHYNISYDESRFYVDYRPVAENLLPDITVLSIGGGS